MNQTELIKIIRDSRSAIKSHPNSLEKYDKLIKDLDYTLEWLLDYEKRPKWKKNPSDESREKAIYGDFECFSWIETTSEPTTFHWLVSDDGDLIQSGVAQSMDKAKKEAESYVLKITSGDD